jgi:hypothetical protein
MFGIKHKNFKTHKAISLNDLVPEDNFYRQVEHCLDLGFVSVLVHRLYSECSVSETVGQSRVRMTK